MSRRKLTEETRPVSASGFPLHETLFALGVAASALYLWAFFSSGVRGHVWSLLLRPDDVLAEWVAFDLRNLGILDRGPVLFYVTIILLAAVGSGRFLLRLAIPPEPRATLTVNEQGLLGLTFGLSSLSLGTLLLGLAGGLHQAWLVRLGVGFLSGLGIQTLTQVNWREQFQHWNSQTRLCQMLYAAAAVMTLMLLWAAALPPWDFDVREYHLQVPKEWYQSGRIEFLPHNVYAQMPLGAEMHPLLAMTLVGGSDGWWAGALAGKVLMAVFVPLTAALIACAASRWLSPVAGAVGALVYLGLPGLSHTAVHGLNEPAVAAFGFFAFYCTLLAKDTPRLTILAGWFAGSALACKYPAVLLIVIPLGLWIAWQQTDRRQVFVFALAVVAACGPWLAKNAIQTGNPVYPLLASVLGGTSRTPAKNEQFRRAHEVPPYTLAQLASAVTDISLHNSGQSPLLIPLGIFSLLTLRGRPELRRHLVPTCLLLIWMFACWWLFTHRIERFWYPAFPFLTLLAVSGLASIQQRWQQSAIAVFIALGVMFQGLFLLSPLAGDTRWFTKLERLRIGESLHPNDVARLPAAFRYLNEHAAEHEAVLFIGEAAVFDSRPRAFYNTCFDDSLAAAWLTDLATAEQSAELARRNITWVFVNSAELDRYHSPGNYGYDPRFREALITELVTAGILEEITEIPDFQRGIKLYWVRSE